MNYHRFQKFSHFLSVLFNVLFWIIIVSGIITAIGFIYIIVNYDNLPNMVEELKYITPDDVSQFLKYSKGYLIMCLVEFVVATGLEVWLYKTISNTAKSFEKSDCMFTLQNYKYMKKLTSVFYCMALSSIAVVSLAALTLSESEANLFIFDETSLILGLVFTFIVFLFKQTARPVIRTIEITETNLETKEDSVKENSTNEVSKEEPLKEEKNNNHSKPKTKEGSENKPKQTKRKTTNTKSENKDN